MGRFKLDKRTSVEFVLFKKFTYFLVEILRSDYAKMRVDKIHEFIGNNILYLGKDSVRNIFVEKGDYAQIDEEKFKAFCEKFVEIYGNLPEERRTVYQAINLAFIDWRNGIYKKNNWQDLLENEDSKEHRNQNQMDKLEIYGEENLIFFTPENFKKHTEFLIRDATEYYLEYDRKNVLFSDHYEWWAFNEWKNAWRERNFKEDFLPKLGNKPEDFDSRWIEIKMIENDKITRLRTQLFNSSFSQDKANTIIGQFYGQDEKLATFYYELNTGQLFLNFRKQPHQVSSKKEAYGCFIFSGLPALKKNIKFKNGLFISVSTHGELFCTLATCENVVREEDQKYSYATLEKNTDEVSHTIKAFLLENEQAKIGHHKFKYSIYSIVRYLTYLEKT